MTNLMLPGFGDPELPDTMPALRQMAMGCTRCRLHQTRTQVTWGMGNPNSPLMVVGMGPSVTDDKTGGAYTGPAGEFLDEALSEAGITRQDIWLTNLHKCVARKKDDPYNIRAPIKAELSACQQWVDREFEIVKPRVLLIIGAPAAKWLLGDDFDLTVQRGQIQRGPFGTRALATYQPTYITRLRTHDAESADEKYQELLADFRLAASEAGLVEG